MNDIPYDWSLTSIWNDLITYERTPKPRNYIRASELGRPFLDRYYTMKGIPFSNPFSPRINRVLYTGKVFEKMLEDMFKMLGLFISSQDEVKLELPGLLPVIGHHDPMVGGEINVDLIESNINNQRLNSLIDFLQKVIPDESLFTEYKDLLQEFMVPDWWAHRVKFFAEQLAEKYPHGLKPLLTEIKTINSHAFWSPKYKDGHTKMFSGYDHHKLQLWTYLNALGHEEGRIFYMSKDDMMILETPVYRDDKLLEQKWKEDVEKFTAFWNAGKEPPHEPFIEYDPIRDTWMQNWKIARSNYFTKITGFNEVKEWEGSLKSEIREKNSIPCIKCGKKFLRKTLMKNNGKCGYCTTAEKKLKKREEVVSNE